MYNSENTKWFSQALLNFKDKVYGTDGYLRISISTNTTDYQYFNPPLLNFSITNNYKKSCNINFQNAQDLYKTFKKVITQLGQETEIDIQRKYQKDLVIHFAFTINSGTNERIVAIELRSSETDFTRIVVPLEIVFEGIASCVRSFTETYMDLCHKLLVQSINSGSTQIIQQLPGLVKGISSQIVAQTPAQAETIENISPEMKKEAVRTEATISDLDDFMGEDMKNISVPELKIEEKKAITEIKSLFIENVIDNDLSNFETMLTNYAMNPAPILALAEEMKLKIQNDIDSENFSMLSGISEDELKSLVYITKQFCSLTYQSHINEETPLPYSIKVFKYDPSTYMPENIDMAIDLLTVSLYIRTVRRRLESKKTDVNQNKSLFYLYMRCFTDPFVFSFLDKIHDRKQLPSIVASRFEYYENVGVFDKYTKILQEVSCPEITKDDILTAATEVIEKAVGKSRNINDLHADSMKESNLRIESKNTFSLEQIINEILPLEIADKTGKDIKNDAVIAELKETYPISDEILGLFKQEKTKKKRKVSNLSRIISFYKDEIPEQHRDDFVKHITQLGNRPIDFNNFDFPLEECGDNIIKSLYLWDPKEDPKSVKNYKHFFSKVEKEIMERDLILTQIKTTPTEEKSNDGDEWNFI